MPGRSSLHYTYPRLGPAAFRHTTSWRSAVGARPWETKRGRRCGRLRPTGWFCPFLEESNKIKQKNKLISDTNISIQEAIPQQNTLPMKMMTDAFFGDVAWPTNVERMITPQRAPRSYTLLQGQRIDERRLTITLFFQRKSTGRTTMWIPISCTATSCTGFSSPPNLALRDSLPNKPIFAHMQ